MNTTHRDIKRHGNIFRHMKLLPNTHKDKTLQTGLKACKATIKAQDILAMSELREKKPIFFPVLEGWSFPFYKISPGFLF